MTKTEIVALFSPAIMAAMLLVIMFTADVLGVWTP